MKIRYDFITNSSSTSFALAAKEVAVVLVSSALIAQAVYSANKAAADAANESFLVDKRASSGTDGTAFVTETAPGPANGPGMEAGSLFSSSFGIEMFRLSGTDDLQTLEGKETEVRQQLGAYKKQYSDFKSGAIAGKDAATGQTDDAYNQYFDYLYKKLDQITSAKYMKIINTAKTKAEDNAKKAWIVGRQHELKDVLDEKAFLQSGAVDSKVAGEMMMKITESEKEIRQSLSENGASADCIPEGVPAAKTFNADVSPNINFSRQNDGKTMEIQELESEKQSLAGQGSERFEMLQRRQDELRREINETQENEAGWEYLTKSAGISRPVAAESLETETMSSFTIHSTQSMKALYSGAFKDAGGGMPSEDGRAISPEVMKWINKGLAAFVNSKFGGKYANQSNNIFSIADSAFTGGLDAFSAEGDIFTAIGSGALRGALGIAKSDILMSNFSSLSIKKDANDLFSWQGLMKYIRDKKPLEKVAKSDLSSENNQQKRIKGESIRLNNFRKES